MPTRINALNEWLKKRFGHSFTLTKLAGDASFRRYFRVHHDQTSYIAMDAPPEQESLTPFINIGKALAEIGVHTPAVYGVEYTQGFMLLEDLGDQLLLNALSHGQADPLYKTALATLAQIQQCPTMDIPLPTFDKAFMLQELTLFRQWFIEAYLNVSLKPHEERILQATFNWLIDEISALPQVFIHRDYHSRNLMVMGENSSPDIAVIDFQDAMLGPFTYDLVSLLKDCYIQWPREQIIHWLSHFYDLKPTVYDGSFTKFIRAFELCGLQRHLKILGIFCRLHLRDQKPTYLQNLPLTFNHVMSCLDHYNALKSFNHFMQQKVHLSFIEKQT